MTKDATVRPQNARRGPSPAAGCLIALLVSFVGIAAVFAAGSLIARGDLVLARGELTETRIWIIRESGEAGLGFSSSKVVSETAGLACVRTDVGFWLWKSSQKSEGVTYCSCYERQASTWEEVGPCEP